MLVTKESVLAYLIAMHVNGKEQVIEYASKTVTTAEKIIHKLKRGTVNHLWFTEVLLLPRTKIDFTN